MGCCVWSFRNEVLELNSKTCEVLTEVFQRLQFKAMHLEQRNLTEVGASALFDMMEYCESTPSPPHLLQQALGHCCPGLGRNTCQMIMQVS